MRKIKIQGIIRRSKEMDPGFGCFEFCHRFYIGEYGIFSSEGYREKLETLEKHVNKNVLIWGQLHPDVKNRIQKITKLESCKN